VQGGAVASTPPPEGPNRGSLDPFENALHHIFGDPDHKLDGLLRVYGGNQTSAYNAIVRATQQYVNRNNITGIINRNNPVTVRVAGYNVTVQGRVMDGVFRLSTAYIKN